MAISDRNKYLDTAKGIAIFLMLWGHCMQYCVSGSDVVFFEIPAFKFIYSFHMPLFMTISGYLFFYSFSKRDLRDLVVHRTQYLLRAIVFCSIFNYLFTTALFNLIKGNFRIFFNGNLLGSLNSLWFLWSVLAASLFVAVICKKVKNTALQVLLLLLAVVGIALFPNAEIDLFVYPYFVIGFYYAKFKDKIPSYLHKLRYVTLVLFPVLLFFFEQKHYIYTTGLLPRGGYSLVDMIFIDAYRWLVGLVGTVFALTLLKIVFDLVTLKFNRPNILSPLSKIGEHSLEFYAFSVPFLSVYLMVGFPKLLSVLNIENVFIKNIFLYSFGFTLIVAVAYSFGLYYLIKLFDKIKLTRILFGK